MLDCDEGGDHAPLLISILDFSHKILILKLAMFESVEKTLSQLKTTHAHLVDTLDCEVKELAQAKKDTVIVDATLKAANTDETSKNATTFVGSSTAANPPFLSRLNIEPAQKATLEDLVKTIQSSQTGKDLALLLASSKGPVVPFIPRCTVEAQVVCKAH